MYYFNLYIKTNNVETYRNRYIVSSFRLGCYMYLEKSSQPVLMIHAVFSDALLAFFNLL